MAEEEYSNSSHGAWQRSKSWVPPWQRSISMAEEAAFLRRLGSCHACHPPFGWQALAKPPSSGCALHGSTYNSQHLNAHTLLSSGDPDQ